MGTLKSIFSGTASWEVWIDEHPVESLWGVVLSIILVSFLLR